MAKAPYLGKDGTVDLDDAIFGEEFHMPVVHETVRAELNARRQGTQSTKTRGEVKMSGAKAFRQKGTGRARAGALSTPQRIGGGGRARPAPPPPSGRAAGAPWGRSRATTPSRSTASRAAARCAQCCPSICAVARSPWST